MPATLTKPVLVFDGECDFCRSCVRFAERITAREFTSVAYQTADLASLGLCASVRFVTKARPKRRTHGNNDWVSASFLFFAVPPPTDRQIPTTSKDTMTKLRMFVF